MMISDTPNVGENPYGMVLSPDGNTLVFGNYTGEVDDNLTHASIGLLDVNEDKLKLHGGPDMARQPLALALTLGLVACEEGYRHTHAFDGPTHSVILDHREMGPYEDAVGFVSSSRNGRIVPSISSTAPCSLTRSLRPSSVRAGWPRARGASSVSWRSTPQMTSK